ncbi:MAG: hypothetical protein IKB75_06390 [Clostridia bacterium]|nr:hypothetical protein [Clostridia bacterium]
MTKQPSTSRTLPEARIEDAVKKSNNGTLAILPFLTPQDAKHARRVLTATGYADRAYFFGGYPTAERMSLFLLPEHLLPCLSAPLPDTSDEELAALLGEDLTQAVCALRITGSGFRTLTHRDYLGAILNLGLERDAFGDIALQSDTEAILFCTKAISDFLCLHLARVASDTVRLSPYVLDGSFTDGRRYAPIHDTVASARLDCVVAALTNLSREDAQALIKSSLVEVDFEVEETVSLSLTAPATLSIRGHGRFILRSFDGTTKKGRLRMFAEKLI